MKNTMLKRLFLWSPSMDTGMAVFSQVLMMVLAYLGLNLFGKTWFGSSILFGLIGALGVGVILPLYWMVVIRERELKEVGITREKWLVSLIVSLILGGLLFWQYYRSFGINATTIPTFLVIAYTLWEVVFVCGWLQLRFEEAFGIIPGIILAGFCFSIYHLGYGWYDLPGLVGLFGAGLFLTIVFRFTRNILILWPFLWPVGCLRGFKMGGFSPDWSEAVFSAVFLVLLLISIFIFYRIQKRRAVLKENAPNLPNSK
jgi:membrane protease YdiL (CAAX protease family)